MVKISCVICRGGKMSNQVQVKKRLIPTMFDPVFKSLFQNKNFRKTLSYFLSKLTKYSENYIYEHLTFLNTEIPIENYEEKKKIADLIIKIDEDLINIESNRNNNKSTILKNNSYHHKLAYEKNHTGQDLNVGDVLQININSKKRFQNILLPDDYKMRNKDGTSTDEENFKRLHINIEFASQKYYTKGKETMTKFEKIVAMLNITSLKDLKDISKGDEDLMAMEKIIKDLNEDKHMIGLYDKAEMDAWMNKIDREEAIAKGEKRGEKRGTKAGILSVARNMLKANMNIDEIAKLTGLHQNEITKLANNL